MNKDISVDATQLSIDSDFYKKYKKAYKYAMEMTLKESYQACEALFHNLNTLQSRSGNQLPFTSINLGTCIKPEGRIIIEDILKVCRKGLGKFHKTSIFPCVIFQCMKGVNRKEGEPNYDLFRMALQCTSERLYPNYMSCDWSVNDLGNMKDLQEKQKVIDSLSDEETQKLVEWCEKNPYMANKLGLLVTN